MLTVVAHHIDMSEDQKAQLATHLPRMEDVGEESEVFDWFRMLGESARMASPGARLVLLTDMTTKMPPDLQWEKLRYPCETYGGINHHRIQAREEFCMAAPEGRYIFCDADVLIREVPDLEADMSFTVRLAPDSEDEGGLKIQEGVVYCNDIACAADYFSAVLDQFEAKYEYRTKNGRKLDNDWLLSQDVTMDMFRPLAMEDGKWLARFTWEGWRMELLPWLRYNWTPLRADTQDPEQAGRAYAWHFKGDRKHLIKPYFDKLRETVDA